MEGARWYRYPLPQRAFLTVATSRAYWVAVVCGIWLATVLVAWGLPRLPLPLPAWVWGVETTGAVLAASALTAIGVGVRPWETVPGALALDGEGLHLLRRGVAWRHIGWKQVLAVQEGRAPVWLCPFAMMGVLSALRISHAGEGGQLYLLASMVGYPDLVREVRQRMPAPEQVHCFRASPGSWGMAGMVLLGVSVIAGLAVGSPGSFPPGPLAAWALMAAAIVLVGGRVHTIELRVGEEWVQVRTASGWKRLALPELSLAVSPVWGYATLRWPGGRAYISAAVIEGYGTLLALLQDRFGGGTGLRGVRTRG